jgi:tetratricopeptide (TPR) repeat protein
MSSRSEKIEKIHKKLIELGNSSVSPSNEFGQHYDILSDSQLDVIVELWMTDMDINLPQEKIFYGFYAEYYDVHENVEKLLHYYLLAAEAGDPEAMNNLGLFYEDGHSVTIGSPNQDSLPKQNAGDSGEELNLMLKYYLMGVEAGSTNAMKNLAKYYFSIKNFDLMVKYLKLAAEKNDIYACKQLVIHYRSIKEFNTMVEYLKNLVQLGDVDSAEELGFFYQCCDVIDKALEYYFIALEGGNERAEEAILNYGIGKHCKPTLKKFQKVLFAKGIQNYNRTYNILIMFYSQFNYNDLAIPLYFELGEHKAVVELLEEIGELDSTQIEILSKLDPKILTENLLEKLQNAKN